MSTKIHPYVNFDNQCREAMTFYQECLGGTLSLTTIGESPMAEKMPHAKEMILHSSLMREGEVMLMASDCMGNKIMVGSNVALSLNCSSEDEITTFFSKLSEGGQVMHPLKVEFWGALFGYVVDQFGIHWMLNYDKD